MCIHPFSSNRDTFDRPRLLALEGPAGVGKTELAVAMESILSQSGKRVTLVSEFSQTPLGLALHPAAAYGQSEPRQQWIQGLGGSLAFLSDQVAQFEAVCPSDTDWIIADRFLISQIVLGIGHDVSKTLTLAIEEIVTALIRWVSSRFHERSVLVFLDASSGICRTRLEARTARPLREHEILQTELESERYRKLSQLSFPWKSVRLDAEREKEVLSAELLGLVHYLEAR